MRSEQPATMVYKTQNEEPQYYTVCACTTDEHTICTEIEIEADSGTVDVMFSFITTTPSVDFLGRLKIAYDVIVKGVHTEYRDITLKPQTAKTWCNIIQKAIKVSK